MTARKVHLPDVVQATAGFEKWAARHVNLVRSDVNLKHRKVIKKRIGKVVSKDVHRVPSVGLTITLNVRIRYRRGC